MPLAAPFPHKRCRAIRRTASSTTTTTPCQVSPIAAPPTRQIFPPHSRPIILLRANNNSGWVATDWVSSSGINGLVPIFGLGNKNNTIPSSAGNRPLNNIGGPNFDTSQAPVVTTAKRTVNYPIGSGPIVIDSTVTVTDADSFFLGSAQVAITANYSATTDSLNYAGSDPNGIQGNFDATTGILTLTGLDTLADWNAALQSVTFTYSGTVVANPAHDYV